MDELTDDEKEDSDHNTTVYVDNHVGWWRRFQYYMANYEFSHTGVKIDKLLLNSSAENV